MTNTFGTVCPALIVGILAGAVAATYIPGVDTHGKIALEFYGENSRQHLELGHLDAGDATGRPPRFWGLQVGSGDSLTTIGVYAPRTTHPHAVNQPPRLPE
jgi:hypothetical protein